MPVCSFKDCTYGYNGKRFSGSAEEVDEHEVTVHGRKPRPNTGYKQNILLIPTNKNVVDVYNRELSNKLHSKSHVTNKGKYITRDAISKFNDSLTKKRKNPK